MKSIQGYHFIKPEDLSWRPSNLMRIPNADYLERTGRRGVAAEIIVTTSSGPICEDLVRLHDLFWRTGKIEFEFSSPAGDMDLDGIQAAVLHPEAELFVDFPETVLLEAIGHAQASVRDGHIAMLIAECFRPTELAGEGPSV